MTIAVGVGPLPSGWRMGRIKDLISSGVNGVWGDEPLGDGSDVYCVRAADFDRVALTVKRDKLPLRSVDVKTLHRHELRRGDLIWEKSGGGETQPVGLAVRFDSSETAICSNFCTRIRPSAGTDSRYLAYVFAAAYSMGLNQRSIKQTTGLQNLDGKAFLAEPWPIAQPSDQRRIADFLDSELSRADDLKAAKEAQAGLLNERAEAIVASKVSSLFDEYGAIPMRRIWSGIEQGWSPQCEDAEADPEEWAVLRTSAVSSRVFEPLAHKRLPADVEPDLRYVVRDGDLLLTRGSGSPAMVGIATVAETGGRRLLLSDLLYRVRLQQGWPTSFIACVLGSRPVRDQVSLLLRGQSGQTIKLRGQDVGDILVPRVPSELRGSLAVEITSMRGKHADAVRRIGDGLQLMHERRRALIMAAVTGQTDVAETRAGTA